jgi:cysteine desulfurase
MVSYRQQAARGMIYLDYQATTPVAPEVAAAMRPWIEEKFANPHSPSRWGREAAAAIEVARSRVEQAIGLAGGSFAFTSSATEALNWAIKGTFENNNRRKLVTVSTEHAAVLDTAEWLEGKGIEIVRLQVGSDGLVDLDLAEALIDDRTSMVAVMLVNNEIGVIQQVADLARMAHSVGALMLCDAVQGFGRLPIPTGRPDRHLGHKIHGPRALAGCGCGPGPSPSRCCMAAGRNRASARAPCRRRFASGSGERSVIGAERARRSVHIEKLSELALATLGQGWIINGSLDRRYRGNLNLRRDMLDGRG